MRAAPAVSRAKGGKKNAHTSIQVQRRTSDIPCAMALRLIRALPGELRSVATVACEPVRKLGASLAAPGPHDFAVRFDTVRQRCRCVHRIPSQRSVTMANAPPWGQDGVTHNGDLGFWKSEFLPDGLLCRIPSGQF